MKEVFGDMELRGMETRDELAKYHDIRKRLLFDVYLPHLKYDPNHPDEVCAANHQLGFFLRGQLIGTIRIDFMGDASVAFRAIAVDGQYQNMGLGSILLKLAEKYAAKHGCDKISLHVNKKATNFYKKNGYVEIGDWGVKLDPASISFGKNI